MFALTATTCVEPVKTETVPEELRDRYPEFDDFGRTARAVCVARGRRLCTLMELDLLNHCALSQDRGIDLTAGCYRAEGRPDVAAEPPLFVSCEFSFPMGSVNGVLRPVVAGTSFILRDFDLEYALSPDQIFHGCRGLPDQLGVRCCLDI